MDVAGDYCPQAPGPQPAAPFRPRLLLRELILAHSPSDPRRSIHGSPLTKSDWLSLMFQATANYWGARSLIDLLFVGQSIIGPVTSLTLIPVRDVPTVFVPAAFWLRLRLRARMAEKRRRRRQVGGYHSRCSDPQWSWFSHDHASFSSASFFLRWWPDRWSCARPAASGGKSIVQD